jgi:hypothetical protein
MQMRPLAEVHTGRLFFALLLLTAFAQPAAAQGRWQKFSAPDRDFAVEFPAAPQHSSIPGDQGGGPIEVYNAISGKHSYGVVYQDAPQPVDGTGPASVKALADGCGLSAQSQGRKLLRVRRLPGGIVECLSTGPSGNDLYPTDSRLERNFVRGRRYYTLSVISWAAGGVDAGSAARFFSSFKLSAALPATPAAGGLRQQQSASLIPKYEYDNFTGVTRVSLPPSPVEGASGATFIKFGARYAYDREWRNVGTMNEVMLFFGMAAREQVCPGRCQLTLTADGERSSFEVEVQSQPNGDTLGQTASLWLKPQAFRRLAGASRVEVQIGEVTFRLTARQMEGLRQMIPFLKERLIP